MKYTTAEALIKYLSAQKIRSGGQVKPFFPFAFAIFGHGNALGIGDALERYRKDMPTIKGQNEQGMALAAVGFSKAQLRTQCGIVTTSIGPGATNVVTAAGVAMANRLPLLILSGDTFQSRKPDPVLQQVEHFDSPTTTVNDSFKSVTRYWDRITKPEQLLTSLPNAVHTLLDPADCGPVFLGLPQDVQVESYEFPDDFFKEVVHEIRRQRADSNSVNNAADAIKKSKKPLIIAGGGVRYSKAHQELSDFAKTFEIPVVETVAGKSSLLATDPSWCGPVGVTGCDPANALAEEADLIIAIGTRLQDFTTGSWTIFKNPVSKIISINTARFDATKRSSIALIGDAKESILELHSKLAGYKSDSSWSAKRASTQQMVKSNIEKRISNKPDLPSYAQVVATINNAASPSDYVLTAAGGLPGELNNNWLSKSLDSFDCEYGYSCMGYEVAGAWGAAIALKQSGSKGKVISMVGDGSYLMLNSEILSAVNNGDSLIYILCDNLGFAVIQRLQVSNGSKSYRTMFNDSDLKTPFKVDFVSHAKSLGARSVKVTIENLAAEFSAAKDLPGVSVLVIDTDAEKWTEGGAFWEVAVSGISEDSEVKQAYKRLTEGKSNQRW
jgi:3D-(3,5/4)-trihydroxycyclohexane-1,2-dione acylhydrolase (decyclizing)